MVSRPFHPTGDTLELAILHPPGGLVEGDSLHLSVEAKAGAQVFLTTPAAQKFYRAVRAWQTQTVTLRAQAATLEWLPQEAIVFPGARATVRLEADIEPGGRFLGWDLVALGAGAIFDQGVFNQELAIRRAGRLLYWERRLLTAPACLRWSRSPLGLAGQGVWGTLWALGRSDEETDLLEKAAASLRSWPDSDALTDSGELNDSGELIGVTVRQGLLLARYLGPSTERARLFLEKAWAEIRGRWGAELFRPRIWST
jgi:urease accessory protein